MAEDRLTIDPASVFDNVDDRRVEFAAEIGGERRAFAIQYEALRALTAEEPGNRAVALFQRESGQIAAAGRTALARDPDEEMVIVSENDL